MILNSKHGHESDLYCSVFDELGAVGKLRSSALQRHQARQKRNSISPVHGHVLKSKLFVGVVIRLGEWTADQRTHKFVRNQARYKRNKRSTVHGYDFQIIRLD